MKRRLTWALAILLALPLALFADFGFWLDSPQVRSNPHDPKSPPSIRIDPLPLAPSPTPTNTPIACKSYLRSISGTFGIDDVAVDSANNIYAAEFVLHCVRKYSSSGIFLQTISFLPASFSDHFPKQLRIRANGNVVIGGNSVALTEASSSGVFVANYSSPQIYNDFDLFPNGDYAFFFQPTYSVVRTNASLSIIWSTGGQGTGAGQFSSGAGVCIGPSGDVYSPDWFGDRIHRFSGSTGTLLTTYSFPVRPGKMRLGQDGNFYVGGSDDRVYVCDSNMVIQCSFGGNGTAPGLYTGILTLAADSFGQAYVTGGSKLDAEVLQ